MPPACHPSPRPVRRTKLAAIMLVAALSAGLSAMDPEPPTAGVAGTTPLDPPAPAAPAPPVTWMPPHLAAPLAIERYEAVALRFDIIANHVYWERWSMVEQCYTPERCASIPELATSRDNLVRKFILRFGSEWATRDKITACLLSKALEGKLSQPHDPATRPTEELLRAASLAWLHHLPDLDELAFLMAPFEFLALSLDEASDDRFDREHPGPTPPTARAVFKLLRMREFSQEHFPGRPECAALFHLIAANWFKYRPEAWKGEDARAARRAKARASEINDQLWIAILKTRTLETTLLEKEAEFRKRTTETAMAKARSEDEARQLARVENQRVMADLRARLTKAEHTEALRALEEAEAAPPSKEEVARLEAERLEQLEQAEARRNLGRHVRKERKKASASATPIDPSKEAKDEMDEKTEGLLKVRWHPKARREFLKAVPPLVRDHIDTFINEKLKPKGLDLGMPHAKPLLAGDGLWELRPLGALAGAWRPLYAKVGQELVVLAFAPDYEMNRDGFREAVLRAQRRRN